MRVQIWKVYCIDSGSHSLLELNANTIQGSFQMNACHSHLLPNHISESLHFNQAATTFCTHLAQHYFWVFFAKVTVLPGRPSFLSCMTWAYFLQDLAEGSYSKWFPRPTSLRPPQLCIPWHLQKGERYVIMALLMLSICCLCVVLGIEDLVSKFFNTLQCH